jgi:hypothetical protein
MFFFLKKARYKRDSNLDTKLIFNAIVYLKKGFLHEFSSTAKNSFRKLKFNECINLLNFNLNEIQKTQYYSNLDETRNESLNFFDNTDNSEKLAINWTELDVEKWIFEKNIQSSILNNIRPCDGKLLYELFSIKTQVPEYFKESLMANQNVADQFSLRDYVVFVNELKNLFLN